MKSFYFESKKIWLDFLFLTILVFFLGACNQFENIANFSYDPLCAGRVPGGPGGNSVDYQWMPDGQAIVILNRMLQGQKGARLHLVNSLDGNVIELMSNPGIQTKGFELSPSARFLAISKLDIEFIKISDNQSKTESHYQTEIFTFNSSGEAQSLYPLITVPNASTVAWSCDESQIALATVPDPSYPRQDAIKLALFDSTISEYRIVDTYDQASGNNPIVGWGQCQKSLVIDRGLDLKIHKLESDLTQVYDERRTCLADIAISPTADKFAMSSHIYRDDNDGDNGWDLVIRDFSTETSEIITDWNDTDETQPAWSPDGEMLVFVKRFIGDSGQATQDIILIDLTSNLETNLTQEFDLDALSPKWSPTGDKIAFLSSDGRNYNLHTVNIDGKQLIDLYSSDDY